MVHSPSGSQIPFFNRNQDGIVQAAVAVHTAQADVEEPRDPPSAISSWLKLERPMRQSLMN